MLVQIRKLSALKGLDHESGIGHLSDVCNRAILRLVEGEPIIMQGSVLPVPGSHRFSKSREVLQNKTAVSGFFALVPGEKRLRIYWKPLCFWTCRVLLVALFAVPVFASGFLI